MTKSSASNGSVASVKSRSRFDLAQCFSAKNDERADEDYYVDADEECFRNYKSGRAVKLEAWQDDEHLSAPSSPFLILISLIRKLHQVYKTNWKCLLRRADIGKSGKKEELRLLSARKQMRFFALFPISKSSSCCVLLRKRRRPCLPIVPP
ncbi:unnamed protein product [Notodromas monacha]|uniref:Uncharacterized protein n=1 Tax=Notodromas monacha TaxID=399045 RepID=A0A7R9BQ13_9CRUS|nr:unnamed protein product [Notodromas monacha]CAG0918042.1 unnamed protein product [Notodromas monacha]